MSLLKPQTLVVLTLCLTLFSCSPYSAKQHLHPELHTASKFSVQNSLNTKPGAVKNWQWWLAFKDQTLNKIIALGLKQNQNLAAAWSRLEQARELATINGSERYPQISAQAGSSRTRNDGSNAIINRISSQRTIYFGDYFVSSGLSFELDLWKRIASKEKAANLRSDAAEADAQNTALLLSGTLTELWLITEEQKALLNLLDKQIEADQTLLSLNLVRFSVGQGTALAVFQQRVQLAATRAQVPIAKLRYQTTLNQIATLCGYGANSRNVFVPQGNFPQLPSFPTLISPIDLVQSRPELRAARTRLQAAEFDVAAAFAERFPKISVGLSYDFRAADISSLFTDEVGRMVSDLSLPLIDGGRRRAVVRQQKQVVQELLHSFGNQYLVALEEVENAIVSEEQQHELLERLKTQEQAASETLTESRYRYLNGLSDYLQVITALQALQRVERQIISEKRGLLVARARLYRAMGGAWTNDVKKTTSKKKDVRTS